MKDVLKNALIPVGFALIFIGFFSQYFLIALGIAVALFSTLAFGEKMERKESGAIAFILLGPGLFLIKLCNAVAAYKMIVKAVSSSVSYTFPYALPICNPMFIFLAGIIGLIISEISMGFFYEFLPKREGIHAGIYICAVGFVLAFIGMGVPFIGALSVIVISSGLFLITISTSLSLISKSEVKPSEGNSEEPS